jgi:exodeoxyribonuclease VII large subunit
MPEEQILTVSQLNLYLKYYLEGDAHLRRVAVCGEISNFKLYPSGHWYFTLKDANGAMPCVFFRAETRRVRFLPANGLRVLLRGRVTLYERDGKVQIVAEDMEPDGLGALYLAFAQRKEKLEKEGLFALERKKTLPAFPLRIGVATSPAGAVLHDILRVTARRWPLAEIILFPTAVQGEGAAAGIASAIADCNRAAADGRADVLIVARGGGSLEDLWAFNEEAAVRAVAESQIPVVSAVGHETDVTLCDFAADVRAATPSAAAELVVPDMREVLDGITRRHVRAENAMQRNLENADRDFRAVLRRALPRTPLSLLDLPRQRLDGAQARLFWAQEKILAAQNARLHTAAQKLEALSPLAALERGYAIIRKNGAALTRAQTAHVNDLLEIRLADGVVSATVTAVSL